jgi:hypothetical protein
MNPPLANTFNTSNSSDGFRGFAAPTSNTTYTPNQFFDVCLPHSSRGCVRLVAFLIRKTLGWCDADGNPQSERHLVSWSDFEQAGISRPMIRGTLNEAIAGRFIKCVRSPRGQEAGQSGLSGLYELQWDERPEYVKDPKEFRGFFAGEGNRTYIPNQYFDHVVLHETLAVVRVVGAVIRFSIGFQNKWGHRRRNVSLSYQHIQNYSHVRDRKTLSSALQHARKSNYIERVEQGYFDPNAGKLSRAAVYAVRWLDSAMDQLNGEKTLPGIFDENSRSEKPTGNGKKTLPGERLENPTGIEIKQTNKTLKQKQNPESAASFEKLKAVGFDDTAASAIADRHSFDHVERQINWLPDRKAANNPLGMLRKAIEENWQAPDKKLSRLNFSPPPDRRGEGFDEALKRIKSRYWDQPSSNST